MSNNYFNPPFKTLLHVNNYEKINNNEENNEIYEENNINISKEIEFNTISLNEYNQEQITFNSILNEYESKYLENENDWVKFNYDNNLDEFYRTMYEYYYEKGINTFICTKITNLLTLLFTISLSFFFFIGIKWDEINNTCLNKESCNNNNYINTDPFLKGNIFFNFIIITFISVFSIYFICNLLIFLLIDIKRIKKIHKFYVKFLKINQKELQILSWDQIIGRLKKLHNDGFKIQFKDEPPTAHEIAARIMRNDNLFICLINQGFFDIDIKINNTIYNIYLGNMLLWNIRNIILGDLFDNDFKLRTSWRNGNIKRSLKCKVRLYSIISFLIMPFFIIFYFCYFILNIAHEFHQKTSSNSISNEKWTSMAKWKFREYNELPHIFEKRLIKSIPFTMHYLKLFNNPFNIKIARFISFLTGSIIGLIIIAVYITSDNILSIELLPFYGLNVLQLLTISGVVLSVSRSYIPEIINKNNLEDNPNKILEEITKYTHYIPNLWINRGHTYEVYNEITKLFKKPIQCFIEDFISTLMIPYILWFKLIPKCDNIVNIVNYMVEPEMNSDMNYCMGDMCGPSLFLKSRNYKEFYQNFIKKNEDLIASSDEDEIFNLLKTSYNDQNNKFKNSYASFLNNYKN